MAGLFSYGDIKNKPRRSGFDLGNKNAFTAKVGELLPVYWKFCLPGDKFQISQEWFTRTQPVDTSAFTRIREYYEWFFVPLHLMYRNSNEAIMSMENQPNYAASGAQSITFNRKLPWVDLLTLNNAIDNVKASTYHNNMFGFDRSLGFAKLYNYLGVGEIDPSKTLTNLRISAFPFYAYQKIYNDYYRHSQWEVNKPWTYNCDFWNGEDSTPVVSTKDLFDANANDSVFELRYANWNKDLYMGAMPNAQFGDVAFIPVNSSGKLPVNLPSMAVKGVAPIYNAGAGGAEPEAQIGVRGSIEGAPTGGQTVTAYGSTKTDASRPYFYAVPDGSVANLKTDTKTVQVPYEFSSKFDVLQLRAVECLQKWKEIAQANGQNYASQVKAHFGVSPNPITSHRSTRVCGFDGSIDISAVENTNLSSDEAIIRGKGIGGYRVNKPETFKTTEHGILMCIYHAVPLLDYAPTGPDLQFMTTVDGDSWPVPEMDSVGFEELPSYPLLNTNDVQPTKDPKPFGYVPRYISWKTSVDVIRGAFIDTLKSWTAPIGKDYLKLYFDNNNVPGSASFGFYTWFKVNPSVVNPIFGIVANGSWNTDQLLVNCDFDVRVARNLSYDGLPY
nr:MAG TPA: Major capsid protein [Microviridae sp.]